MTNTTKELLNEESVLDNQLQDLNEYLTNQSEELDPCSSCQHYNRCMAVGDVPCPGIDSEQYSSHDEFVAQWDAALDCNGICKECRHCGISCFNI